MNIISHQRNSIPQLLDTNPRYGVEVDIRSDGGKLIIHHDPFLKGESFEEWINFYNHGTLILNVKEEGLEERLIRLLQLKSIDNFSIDRRVKTKISYISKCKACLNLLSKGYRETHIDTRNRTEYRKFYYDSNKIKFKEWNKNWRNNNNRSEYYREYRSKIFQLK
jgi:hypothetical protein